MLKVSIVYEPHASARECIDIIRMADDMGFYACYLIDVIHSKDFWLLLGAAADKTKRIRLGPNATHVMLREPTLIAQGLATLDELSGGRAEAVISFGGVDLLSRYRIQWQGSRPVARLKEAFHVIRTLLNEGRIDFEGEFFKYRELFTSARPVQKCLPLKMGVMGGPLALEAAGEVADGVHVAPAYTRQMFERVIERVKVGAQRAVRDWRELDIAAVPIWVCAEDSRAAKELARIHSAFYIASAMPEKAIQLQGLPAEGVKCVKDAFAKGGFPAAAEVMTSEMAEVISVAGTPEECVEKLKRNILPAGINHVVAMIVDPLNVESYFGKMVTTVPDVKAQMKLIYNRVLPALS